MLNDKVGDVPSSDVAGRVIESAGVALVTGGRRGIGRAICRAMAAQGFDIALLDIVEDDLAYETLDLVSSSGRKAWFGKHDIANISTHQSMIHKVQAELGAVTCLVNNAGIQVAQRGDLLDCDEADFDRLIGINLRGTFFLTQAVASQMLSVETQRDRSIITLTSANAHLVSPEKGPYCISKAGLSMAMQQFAVRLAPHGIRVHEVRPGLIRTDMTADVFDRYDPDVRSGKLGLMRRWGEPEDIGVGVAALAAGAIPFSTGDIFNIGGGLQIPQL